MNTPLRTRAALMVLAGTGLLAAVPMAQASRLDPQTAAAVAAVSAASGAAKGDSRKPAPAAVAAPVAAPVSGGEAAGELVLVGAVIDAIEPEKAMLTLRGQPAYWDPSRLKIYKDGSGEAQPVSVLRRGLPIRFALEPGSAPDRRIVLIVLGGQPQR